MTTSSQIQNVQNGQSFLSPKQVAAAIGVSESSLKRWCDRGVIESHRTEGGHRRLAVSAVLEFVRQNDYRLPHPEVLGLPATVRRRALKPEVATARLLSHLVAGDREGAVAVGLEAFVSAPDLSHLFDGVLSPALHEIGRMWQAGTLEVFRERRAVGIVHALLHDIDRRLPSTADGAPTAIGATLTLDHYDVAVRMAELVLRERGFSATTLGSHLPVDTVIQALDTHSPRLLWLSVTHIDDEATFIEGYNRLYEAAVARNVAVALGGAAIDDRMRKTLRATSFGRAMADLVELARALAPA